MVASLMNVNKVIDARGFKSDIKDSATSPLFSIVTVCLNDKEGLIRTRQSIRNQTISDYEWIVIDGASKDGTKEFLEQLPADECHWISEPDKGLYDAMNKGIDKATGRYLLFLNSGDELVERGVLHEVSKMLSCGSIPDFIYGDSLERNQDGSLIYKPARNHKYLWYGMFTHHQAMFYKKEALGSLRYSLSYPVGADYGLTAALIGRRGVTAVYFPSAVCIFERGGISAKNIKQGAIDQFSIRRSILCYPVVVCIVIRFGHAIVRGIRKIAPSLHQLIRYSGKNEQRDN